MDAKINGSVYHKFINNYQRPILIAKKDSKNIQKEIINKKNTLNSFHSKLIYVNKKTLNYPTNQNQNDVSSETKSFTNNSDRTFTSHQNPQKSEKNGVKSLLNEVNNINILSNGLPSNQKNKKKSNQSAHNELNKINCKSIEDYDNNNNSINNYLFKKEIIKNNKNNEISDNALLKLKKLQNSIINIHTNGNFDNSNRKISNHPSNDNINESKRKKNYSLNYNKDGNSNPNINIITNVNSNKSKEKKK